MAGAGTARARVIILALMQPELASTPTTLPPRLKLWAVATRWLLALLLFCALLLGLGWALLHWMIVPRIDEFRPALQNLARQATGLQIEIGQLQARSSGLMPSFELSQVSLLDTQGQPALRLPRVLVAISPRSVAKLGLEQLVIEGAELELRRTRDGRLVLAGIDMSAAPQMEIQPALDWLFSQTEWALRGGLVRWHDELQNVRLELRQVDWVMRNSGQRHQMRLDATPDPQWGDRFSLRGLLRQPLLSGGAGNWRSWNGELYAEFGRIEAAPLQAYARLAGIEVEEGRGAIRSWMDVQKGRVVGILADVQLQELRAQAGPKLPPLRLKQVQGRLGWQQMDRSVQASAESLSVESLDGQRWSAGQLRWTGQGADLQNLTRQQFEADQLDLASLTSLALRLPLPTGLQDPLRSLQAQGRVEGLQMSWQGPLEKPEQAQASARIRQLALAAGPPPADGSPGRPGLQGADLDFQWKRDKEQDSAQGQLRLEGGWLELPGVFAEPRVALESLSVGWKLRHSAGGTEISVESGQLRNSDAQAQFQGHWKRQGTGPGELDLQGQIAQADGSRVHRYLPLTLGEGTRRYLQEALPQGQLSEARFKVKGALARFPFRQASEGEFQVSARLRNARYQYVPAYLGSGSKPWPALERLEGQIQINRNSLQISQASAQVAGLPGLGLSKVQARIAELGPQARVEVSGDLKGPLAQALRLVQTTPLSTLTRGALDTANGAGAAEIALRLNLPLDDLSQSTVQGTLILPGNELQISSDLPPLNPVKANLQFTQNSLQISSAQARVLGGEMRFEGALRARTRETGEPEAQIRAQGQLTAEALQQIRGIAGLAHLARSASGSTSYNATISLRQGWLEFNLQSRLQGLGLNLPEPLNKPASSEWPLRIERSMVLASLDRRPQDRIRLQLGPLSGLKDGLQVSYLRDVSGDSAQVLGGEIALGAPLQDASPGAVRALIDLPSLDLDSWNKFSAGFPAGETGATTGSGYMPSILSLRTDSLRAQGHTFQQLVVGATREGTSWRANIHATELSGYAEYRASSPSTAGRVYARLARLALGQGSSSNVEALLDNQPSTVPALDIVVDDLELRGRDLGRLEMEAVNRNSGGVREWRLNKLSLSVPEAKLSATGNWAAAPGARPNAPRLTQLNFGLDIEDSGALLKRMGIDGAVRRGKGKMEGRIGWSGSPLNFNTQSLQGQFVVDLESGQFLKADPGAARLLGVLNLQSLPRRLTLDFRDVFSEGFAFDWIRGEVIVEQGVARTESLRMKGVNAAVLMAGTADVARETQDLRVVVIPEINAGTASLLAAAVNPIVGLGTLIAQWLLRRPLNEATTQEFTVRGTWADPVIEKVSRKTSSSSGGTP